MITQFIGKPFWITLGILAGTFGISILVFQTAFILPVLILVFVATTALTIKKLEWGIAAAFAELFANSHGHLMTASVAGFPLSLREVVFLGVMLGWLYLIVTRKATLSLKDARLTPFIMLGAAAVVGFIIGFAQNDRDDAFKDGNAYFYIAYVLPILSARWDKANQRLLLQVLTASAVWVGVVTIGLLYVFTHFPEWVLGPVYQFIRDTRTGELTKMCDVVASPAGGNFCGIFRIFLQAQISVIVMTFVLCPFLWIRGLPRKQTTWLLAALSFALMTILISLSRSFWIGIIAGGLVSLGLTVYAMRPRGKDAARAVSLLALTLPLAAIGLALVLLFPFPYRVGTVGDLASLFSSRTTDTSDVAISSRWNLLDPLLNEVKAHPFIGSGFGETVTFETDDPRARAVNPDGTWTTYALEWGWLEIWLKMGLLGIAAFLWLFVASVKGMWPYLRSEKAWLGVAGISILVMLYATQAFSPYLNHPLGLGILLFFIPFWKSNAPELASEAVIQASMAPLTSELPRTNVAASMDDLPSG